MYVEILKGYMDLQMNNKTYDLELLKNLYGQKKVGWVLNKYIH